MAGKAELFADGESGAGVVASDHFYLDAGGGGFAD